MYLSFTSEAEGDEYVRHLEALLDRGVVPEELANTKAAAKDLRSQVSEYRSAQHISVDDEQQLPVLLSRLPIGITLPQLTFTWATEWVTTMKREQNLAPSTIRHYVGALSRALDWLAAHGALPMNPLRLLPAPSAVGTSSVIAVSKPLSTSPCRCFPSRLGQLRSVLSCRWTWWRSLALRGDGMVSARRCALML
ncbi:hypothetical protein [Stenotrophomonas sp. 59]|uniref:hypothetical protein n=1 Tax=Stenotrophomonas sp. 59 TaxID=3051120 RepID=UPI00256EC234|nr:hypothetical protein [Stenotrophomonas sp. 59]